MAQRAPAGRWKRTLARKGFRRPTGAYNIYTHTNKQIHIDIFHVVGQKQSQREVRKQYTEISEMFSPRSKCLTIVEAGNWIATNRYDLPKRRVDLQVQELDGYAATEG